MMTGGIYNEGSALVPSGGRDRRPRVMQLEPTGDRVPPNSNEAEMAVLGAMMLDREAASKVIQILQPDAFYRETHRIIYTAMLALSERNQPIDIITINDELRRQGRLADVGGSLYLSELNMRTPTAANVEHHARIVFEKALKRRLISAAMEIISSSYNETTDAFEELDHAEQQIFEIAESRGNRSYHSMKRLAFETMELLETLAARRTEGHEVVGVPSGIVKLDNLLGGFQRSDLIILAARPSMGKTALAMSIARNAAIDYKRAVAFFSLEMSAQQLVMRLISAEAKVDAHRLRTGDLKNEHWQQIVSTIHRLTEAPMYIDDTPALGIMELRARARLMRREHNVEMIVIDYLQLMHAPKAESREREISMISRGLKQLAKELDIPIIALSQLNRGVEARGDKRPMLSDLRESGCLTGDTPVALADSGSVVTMRQLVDLVGGDRPPIAVWALNEETGRLERAEVTNAFSTGVKAVFRLTTRLGRTIRASANHRFLTIDGWKRLDELRPGEHLAVPRALPAGVEASLSDAELALMGHLVSGRAAIAHGIISYRTVDRDVAEVITQDARSAFGPAGFIGVTRERGGYTVQITSIEGGRIAPEGEVLQWMREHGLTEEAPAIPASVFRQPRAGIARFLRHLWTSGGVVGVTARSGSVTASIYYGTTNRALAQGLQSLLLRLGIKARIRATVPDSRYHVEFRVVVDGRLDQARFAATIGSVGRRQGAVMTRVARLLNGRSSDGERNAWTADVIPAIEMRTELRLHSRMTDGTATPPPAASMVAARLRAVVDAASSSSEQQDIYWDPIMDIERVGSEEVFDLTVPGPHNFVAGDIVVHNSIEQDADVVMFVHRPEYYGITQDEDGNPTEGTAEVIIGKQRNGPTGTAKLAFISEYARFENLEFRYDDAPQYLPPPSAEEPPF